MVSCALLFYSYVYTFFHSCVGTLKTVNVDLDPHTSICPFSMYGFNYMHSFHNTVCIEIGEVAE